MKMKPEVTSPAILEISWGRITIDGAPQPYKDAKLFPGGSRRWDWKETGTRHTPGIQPADVEELLSHGATSIILSQGYYRRLAICPETLDYLKQRNITVHVAPTKEAVELYNQLRATEKVGALIHTTC
jgi:hypothetical protein